MVAEAQPEQNRADKPGRQTCAVPAPAVRIAALPAPAGLAGLSGRSPSSAGTCARMPGGCRYLPGLSPVEYEAIHHNARREGGMINSGNLSARADQAHSVSLPRCRRRLASASRCFCLSLVLAISLTCDWVW